MLYNYKHHIYGKKKKTDLLYTVLIISQSLATLCVNLYGIKHQLLINFVLLYHWTTMFLCFLKESSLLQLESCTITELVTIISMLTLKHCWGLWAPLLQWNPKGQWSVGQSVRPSDYLNHKTRLKESTPKRSVKSTVAQENCVHAERHFGSRSFVWLVLHALLDFILALLDLKVCSDRKQSICSTCVIHAWIPICAVHADLPPKRCTMYQPNRC